MELDYTAIKFWIDVLQFVGLAGLGLFGWQMRRDKAQDTRISNFEKVYAEKLAEHEARLTRAEEVLKHVPASREVGELQERISALGGAVDRLNRGLDRINDYMIDSKK